MMRKIKFGGKSRKPAADKIRLKNIQPSAVNVFLFRYNFGTKIFGLLLLFVIILPNFGCESPSLKANSSKSATAEAQKEILPGFEKDLQSMRNADFDFIYVFRRKDGGVLDGEDKKYLKAYSPAATNRFVLTDENKAAIAGSSYKFEPENLDNLQKRFVIENFSKPQNQAATANQNSGKQENYDGK
ncbi:MAG TPA: hypothetical protein VNI84_07050 [Pyrinomonadaceae bacterium]|nr:hypothetical protein [Pyrinomonadaceae bacterium]